MSYQCRQSGVSWPVLNLLVSPLSHCPLVCCQSSLVIMQPGCSAWEEEAVQELDRLTLCATWKVVMVRRHGWRGDTPTIQVVDTTTDQVQDFVCCPVPPDSPPLTPTITSKQLRS